MDSSSGCKTSAYVAPMVIVLVLLVGILVFGLWYYFAQLKPRLGQLVMDKKSGTVGLVDASGAQLLLRPPVQPTQSSRISVVNTSDKSSLNFDLFTTPITGNTRQQVQMMIANPQGSASVPLTTTT